MHDPEFAPSLDIVVGETLPALAQLKEEGHIGGIGRGEQHKPENNCIPVTLSLSLSLSLSDFLFFLILLL